MKLAKCFKHALNMVLHSKLRSWLTIIGIIIGVGAVVAIITFGEALQNSVTSQFGGLGDNIITLSPGRARAFGSGGGGSGGGAGRIGGGGNEGSSASATDKEIVLTHTDVQAVRGLNFVDSIDTEIRGSSDAYYFGKSGSISITGVDPSAWSKIATDKLKEGRLLGPADLNVIVVSSKIATDFFGKPLGINQMITIKSTTSGSQRAFRVIGVTDDDNAKVYMPLQNAYELIETKKRDQYDSVLIKIKDSNLVDDAVTEITQKLTSIRHVTDKTQDFSVTSPKLIRQQRSDILSTLTLFLTAIAAVALIVGAVGIANTMFTSVLEKTKEIGIMKAIGAKNKDILTIFLLNAALIGLVGGIIGIIFGALLSNLLPLLLKTPGGSEIVTSLSMQTILMAIIVSVGIGIISGIIPAHSASKLKPVDALRYE